jgi:hypothetical protein
VPKSVGRPVGHPIKVTPKHLSQLKRNAGCWSRLEGSRLLLLCSVILAVSAAGPTTGESRFPNVFIGQFCDTMSQNSVTRCHKTADGACHDRFE